jgi:hypothetical protein
MTWQGIFKTVVPIVGGLVTAAIPEFTNIHRNKTELQIAAIQAGAVPAIERSAAGGRVEHAASAADAEIAKLQLAARNTAEAFEMVHQQISELQHWDTKDAEGLRVLAQQVVSLGSQLQTARLAALTSAVVATLALCLAVVALIH